MIDIRIYRAALLPLLPALVIVMFSLQERPRPLGPTLAPDAFDAKGTYATVREVTAGEPDRRPGSAGDRSLAALVAVRLRSLSGSETSRDDFAADFDGDRKQMTNVISTLSGPSDRQIVVLAHRDSYRAPGASSATDTAVLLELAKTLAGVRHNKTVVFVSTDGAQADSAGVRRFADNYPDREKVDAVLVLGDVGSAFARRPYLVPWSSGTSRGSLQVLRTANAALERELGSAPGSESAAGQFMRLAWPLTLREQGPLVDRGLDAITLTAHGEVPLAGGRDSLDRISRLRILHFGKAALSTVLALDSAPAVEPSPSSYISFGRKLLPGWAASLFALALLAPVLAAAVDGFARARRRGRAVGPWIRWTLGTSVPFLLMFGAAYVFGLLDWMPRTASEALAPASRPSAAEAAPALGGLALVFALGWVVVRPFAAGGTRLAPGVRAPETGLALALLLSVALLLVWTKNPFAVLLLVPAAHACVLPAVADRSSRPALAVSMTATAVLLPALAALYYGARLDLGVDVSRYALLFVAGGGSAWNVLLVSLIAGTLLAMVLLALVRPEPERLSDITIRGPRTYAGPGSLGGTESTLKR